MSSKSAKTNFDSYIVKLKKNTKSVKDVHITKEAVELLDNYIKLVLKHLTLTACDIVRASKMKTLTLESVRGAVGVAARDQELVKYLEKANDAVVAYAGSETGMQSERAGLILSVPRAKTCINSYSAFNRGSPLAYVYLTAVVERLVSNLLVETNDARLSIKATTKRPKQITARLLDVTLKTYNGGELLLMTGTSAN